MEHPVREIPSIIHALTEGSPAEQKAALDTYFVPHASFTHPLCRVPSFSGLHVPGLGQVDSRWVVWMIYRWYKILSPVILLGVESVVYDQKHALLYVSIHQTFSLFFVPFYKSHVKLVTVLKLSQSEENSKYYIESQEDLYQSNEVVKFFWPGGNLVVKIWGWIATLMCIVGALVLAPLTWVEQRVAVKKA